MKVKIKFCHLLAILLCLCVFNACGDEPDPINAEMVKLNKTDLSLAIGESAKLQATVLPSNATDKTVSWSSSNTNVAMVSNQGEVTAVGGGTATITASCGNVSASCSVTVTAYEYVFGYAYSEDLLKFVTPTITLAIDGQEPLKYSIADGNHSSAEKSVSFHHLSISFTPTWPTIWWKGELYSEKRTGKLTITYTKKDVDYSQFEESWKNNDLRLFSKPFVNKSEGKPTMVIQQWITINIGSNKTLEQAIDDIISASSNTETF